MPPKVCQSWWLATIKFARGRLPARNVPSMATGYHMLFWLNKATVSPCFRPYFFTSAVERYVVTSLTCFQLRRSLVMAFW